MPDIAKTQEVQFHFVKSNFFRVIHADGVAGGISPKGTIQLSFFNERLAIPKLIVHQMLPGPGGTLVQGDEIVSKREGKEGVVREVESEVVMTAEVAESFSKWLVATLEQLKQIKGSENAPK